MLDWSKKQTTDFAALLERIILFAPRDTVNDSYKHLYTLWYDAFAQAPLPTISVASVSLRRARPNEAGQMFSEEWEISYNSRHRDKILLGRFNEPGQSVFYASVPTDESQEWLMGAVIESKREILREGIPKPYLDVTVGSWLVERPFEAVNLCLDEEHTVANPWLQEPIRLFLAQLQSETRPDVFSHVLKFWRLASAISCYPAKQQNDYLFSASLYRAMYDVRKNSGDALNGIIYPSSQTEKRCVNIVLAPEAVDEFLSLKTAIMFRIKPYPNTQERCMFNCTPEVRVEDKRFSFPWYDERENIFGV